MSNRNTEIKGDCKKCLSFFSSQECVLVHCFAQGAHFHEYICVGVEGRGGFVCVGRGC